MRFIHSHSFHGAFDECKARFYLLQTGAPRSREANNFLFGRTFHKFAELYRNHCIARSRWSDVEIVGDLIDEAFRITGLSTASYEAISLLAKTFVANERIDIERSLQREAGIALDENLQLLPWSEDYEYDSPNFAHPFTACACEGGNTCANCRIPGDGRCLYCGETKEHARHLLFLRMQLDEVLIDAGEHLLVIDDWKTDYFVPSQSDIDDPEKRWWKQGVQYAWGALHYLYPSAVAVEVNFKFVRWNVKRTIVFYRDEIEAFAETFVRRINFIEQATEFPATPGEHCRSCPFIGGACPIAAKTAKYGDDIEALAAKFVYVEAVQAERRDALKGHAGTDGIIMVGGLPVAIFEKTERHVLDVRKALEAMRAEGIEGPEYLLDISPSKLKDKLDADLFARVIAAATDHVEGEVVFNVHQTKPQLVCLAESLGIPDPQKMKVAQLALAIAKATSQKAA